MGTDAAGEDQEVENQSQTGQVWDFEAFLYNNSTDTLYMVAGYDFMTGQGTGPYGGAPLDGYYSAGDVFVHASGVDYVIDFDRIVDTNNAAYNLAIDQNGVGNICGSRRLHQHSWCGSSR